jgi:c-di-GMP-binding flagellar brake protein YcgR
MNERRKYRRANFSIKLIYKVMGIKGEVPLKSIDIGGGGIKIRLKGPIKVGTQIELGMNLPKNGDLFFALGRIAWQAKTAKKDIAGKYLYETGIEFLKLDVIHRTKMIGQVYEQLKEGKSEV